MCSSDLFNTPSNSCTATGTYTVTATGTPAPSYTYTFTGATTGSSSGTGSGSVFNAGITNVKVTATNSCGSIDCNFQVSVTDNVLPVITGCPLNITVNTGIGRTTCDQIANWTEPAATDNCTPVSGLTWTKSHFPGAVFPVGTTTVTYTVKDLANNSAICTFTVTVVDNTPPVFSAPSNITVSRDANCSNTIPPVSTTGDVTVKSDNCTPAANLVVTNSDGPVIQDN